MVSNWEFPRAGDSRAGNRRVQREYERLCESKDYRVVWEIRRGRGAIGDAAQQGDAVDKAADRRCWAAVEAWRKSERSQERMRVSGFRGGGEGAEWDVSDDAALAAALRTRDARGGNWFHLCFSDDSVCLSDAPGVPHVFITIRVGGDLADISFNYSNDEPGLRCIGGMPDLARVGYTVFHTTAGNEEVYNEFVVPFDTAIAVAQEFRRTGALPACVEWLKL